MQKTDELSESLKALHKLIDGSDGKRVNANESEGGQQKITLTLSERIKILRDSIKKMIEPYKNLERNSDETRTIDALERAGATISMYISNLLSQMTNMRYRKISTTNPTFQTNVHPVENHKEVFTACGFELKGTSYEWVWGDKHSAQNESQKHLPQTSHPTMDEQKIIMQECVDFLKNIKIKGVNQVMQDINSLPHPSASASEINVLPEPVRTPKVVPKIDEVSISRLNSLFSTIGYICYRLINLILLRHVQIFDQLKAPKVPETSIQPATESKEETRNEDITNNEDPCDKGLNT